MSWLRSRIDKAGSRVEQHLAAVGGGGGGGGGGATATAATNNQQQQQQYPAGGAPTTPQNATLFQGFEWHTPKDHWRRLSGIVPSLAEIGITSLWLPPGCKANSPQTNGYDCYDLWDLGEFDQKWSRATKWGDREQLAALVALAKTLGIAVVWDTVLNHKTAGDSTEECWAVEVDPEDRRIEITRPRKIEPWIVYDFPGRGNTYSSLKWHWYHFNGTDWDQRTERNAIYKILDPPETAPRPGAPATTPGRRRKDWAEDVDDEHGNADFLMFSNIDHSHPEVRDDLMKWGEWMINDVGVDGFRLDAVQHYSWHFTRAWIDHVKQVARQKQQKPFIVGEFWMDNVGKLAQWTDRMGEGVMAFDTPLHNNFRKASLAKGRWDVDMRKIFRNTLVAARPRNAVTMITNHDTQPGQSMGCAIAPFFKAIAYTIMLLRWEGLPCVFYGDLYGTQGPRGEPPACWDRLPALMLARKLYAYGRQTDYLESRASIGWVRHGTWDRSDGCAVLLSIGGASKLKMDVGQEHQGEQWVDVLSNCKETVTIDDRGFGLFACMAKNVSVWVRRDAVDRDQFAAISNANRFRLP